MIKVIPYAVRRLDVPELEIDSEAHILLHASYCCAILGRSVISTKLLFFMQLSLSRICPVFLIVVTLGTYLFRLSVSWAADKSSNRTKEHTHGLSLCALDHAQFGKSSDYVYSLTITVLPIAAAASQSFVWN